MCARPRKQLYIIEAEEDDGEGPEGVIEDEEEEDPQISIHALTGIPSYSTMRVLGSVGNWQLHILVDSGSTHNFLKIKVAKKLQCDIQPITPLNVGVADGKRLTSTEACHDFTSTEACHDFRWNMQGNWFKTDVLLLPLKSYDMILGV